LWLKSSAVTYLGSGRLDRLGAFWPVRFDFLMVGGEIVGGR